MKSRGPCLTAILTTLLASCASGGGDPDWDPDARNRIPHIYARGTKTLDIEVDYQDGAAPYTRMESGAAAFDLLESNLDQLFSGRKELNIQKDLAQMEELGGAATASFTAAQIREIAAAHRSTPDTADSASFYVLFLNGYFDDGTKVRDDVLGMTLGGASGIIPIFKPAIASYAGTLSIRILAEQTTIIHGLGHAIGLVNYGVPMQTPHQDAAHGAHDLNPQCVMYYMNESLWSVAAFVQQAASAGTRMLFDQNCLDDVAALLDAAP